MHRPAREECAKSSLSCLVLLRLGISFSFVLLLVTVVLQSLLLVLPVQLLLVLMIPILLIFLPASLLRRAGLVALREFHLYRIRSHAALTKRTSIDGSGRLSALQRKEPPNGARRASVPIFREWLSCR